MITIMAGQSLHRLMYIHVHGQRGIWRVGTLKPSSTESLMKIQDSCDWDLNPGPSGY